MSNLPELDSLKIIQKFSEKTTDLTYQVVQLQVLVETLKEQRDSALRDRHEANKKVEELSTKLARYEDSVPDVVGSVIDED